MRWTATFGYAKDSSSALKSGAQTVEECAKSLIGSVYQKFHLVPDELLRNADHMPDTSVATAQVAPAVPNMARTAYAKCELAAKELYTRYEPMAEQCATSAWQQLNQLTLFQRVSNVVLPKAAYCTEKYNEVVVATAGKGYRVSSYLTLVQREKIARVFTKKA